MDMKQQAIVMALTTGIPLNECFRIIDERLTKRIQKEKKAKKSKGDND